MSEKNKVNLISPFQSHYFQALYDEEGKEFDSEDQTPLDKVKFDKLKAFVLFPLPQSPMQAAFVVEYEPGYRLIYRKEGVYSMMLKNTHLATQQGGYTIILGLVVDDGTEEAQLIEKGVIGSLRNVNWGGGFQIIVSPEGAVRIIGSVEVTETLKEVAGKQIQFVHTRIKY
jgi:hypothetical protein